jgi:hypothetical protein
MFFTLTPVQEVPGLVNLIGRVTRVKTNDIRGGTFADVYCGVMDNYDHGQANISRQYGATL